MSAEADVPVTFAEGVRDDVASLIANASGEAGRKGAKLGLLEPHSGIACERWRT